MINRLEFEVSKIAFLFVKKKSKLFYKFLLFQIVKCPFSFFFCFIKLNICNILLMTTNMSNVLLVLLIFFFFFCNNLSRMWSFYFFVHLMVFNSFTLKLLLSIFLNKLFNLTPTSESWGGKFSFHLTNFSCTFHLVPIKLYPVNSFSSRKQIEMSPFQNLTIWYYFNSIKWCLCMYWILS